MNLIPLTNFEKIKEKIDHFEAYSSYFFEKYDLKHYLSTSLLSSDYLNYHQILLYNFVDQLEKQNPNLSEQKIESMVKNNFHTVIFNDFEKNFKNNDDYKIFFQKLVNAKYLTPQSHHAFFNFTLLENTPTKEEIVSIFLSAISNLPTFQLEKKYNVTQTPLKSFTIINEFELAKQFSLKHIPDFILNYIDTSFNDDKFTYTMLSCNPVNKLPKEFKNCFKQFNTKICEKLSKLKNEDFVDKFRNMYNVLNYFDKKIVAQPFFQTMILEKVKSLQQQELSYILSIIKQKDKSQSFDQLNSEIFNLVNSKIDLTSILSDTKSTFYSRKLSFKNNNQSILFPKQPEIFDLVKNNHFPHMRIDTFYNNNTNNPYQETVIEFLTEKELIVSSKELLDLLNTPFPQCPTIESCFNHFLNQLNIINDKALREKREHELLSQINTETQTNVISKHKPKI